MVVGTQIVGPNPRALGETWLSIWIWKKITDAVGWGLAFLETPPTAGKWKFRNWKQLYWKWVEVSSNNCHCLLMLSCPPEHWDTVKGRTTEVTKISALPWEVLKSRNNLNLSEHTHPPPILLTLSVFPLSQWGVHRAWRQVGSLG